MLDSAPVTGLHTPITNIPPTESTVVVPKLSPGSTGVGELLAIEEGSLVETVVQTEMGLESAVELAAPDMSGLEDIGIASFGATPALEAVSEPTNGYRSPTLNSIPGE